jgi:hypothetical protein
MIRLYGKYDAELTVNCILISEQIIGIATLFYSIIEMTQLC